MDDGAGAAGVRLTSVNTYQIRTKYVLRISIFVAYLRFEMGKIRTAYFSWGYIEPISSSIASLHKACSSHTSGSVIS